MKKIFLIQLLILALVSVQCRKAEPPAPGPGLIVGKWYWVETNGGLAGVHETPENTGRKMVYEFLQEGLLRVYVNETLEREIKYVLIDSPIADGSSFYQLHLGDNNPPMNAVFENTDHLILSDSYADGFTYHFKRMQ